MAKKLFVTDNRAFSKALAAVMREYGISTTQLMNSCPIGHTVYGDIKKAS